MLKFSRTGVGSSSEAYFGGHSLPWFDSLNLGPLEGWEGQDEERHCSTEVGEKPRGAPVPAAWAHSRCAGWGHTSLLRA